MLTILKLAVIHSIAQKALGSFQGALVSYNHIIKHLDEHINESALTNSYIIKLKAAGKGKVKPAMKGATKGSTGGSKGKGEGKTSKGKPNNGANNNKPAIVTKPT